MVGARKGSGCYGEVIRDRKCLWVGTGEHRRLAFKPNLKHVGRAYVQQEKLLNHLSEKQITPEHYKIVRVGLDAKTGLQEYFHRPSLEALERFLNFRQTKRHTSLNELEAEDLRLCKQFLGKHKGLTLEKIKSAEEEIFLHLSEIGEIGQIKANIVVVGTTRDGKLRLAIVDV